MSFFFFFTLQWTQWLFVAIVIDTSCGFVCVYCCLCPLMCSSCDECRVCTSVHACWRSGFLCMFSVAENCVLKCEKPHFHPVQRVTAILWPLYSRGFSLHKAHFVTVNRPGPAAGLQWAPVPSCCFHTAREEPLEAWAVTEMPRNVYPPRSGEKCVLWTLKRLLRY